MKYILICVFFATINCTAQHLSETATLRDGTVIKIGDSIFIEVKPSHEVLDVVQPVKAFSPGFDTERQRRMLESVFIGSFMRGNMYEIQKISDRRVSKKPDVYEPVALITDRYADTDPNVTVWFVVYLNKGIENGVIRVVQAK